MSSRDRDGKERAGDARVREGLLEALDGAEVSKGVAELPLADAVVMNGSLNVPCGGESALGEERKV